ncbi:ER membrane protein complex subunit 3 [Echinococcus granulosus]|nr:ER membrane protein complex subunit 3 [Echinococcus granulosus]
MFVSVLALRGWFIHWSHCWVLMVELILDSAIRFWVFLPIVIITFFYGVIRHYLTILMVSNKKPDLQAVSDSHALIRSRLLRENGNYITRNILQCSVI